MADRLTQFEWTVAAGGYKWEALKGTGEGTEGLYLTNGEPYGGRYAAAKYSPSPGLFRSFVDLVPEPGRILPFANRWGMLTNGILVPRQKVMVLAEPIDVWISQIADLSLAFRIWEAIRTGDAETLGRHIKWVAAKTEREAPAVMFDYSGDGSRGGRWIATRESNPDLLKQLRFGDLMQPAWHQLQYMVNEKLDANVSVQLLWTSDGSRLSRYQEPKDLASALWDQLARAVEGNREYRQCEVCMNWFEVSSPEGGRADKRYCSTPCRARAWRETKRREK